MSKPKVLVGTHVSHGKWRALQRIAKEEERSMSALLRILIDKKIEKNKREKDAE